MRARDFDRTIIIGNSGAGKSTLAAVLAERGGSSHVALDDIYWDGPAAVKKRVEPAAKQLTTEAAAAPRWVIEGVFGWLVEVAVPRANTLIWLDLPWSECQAGLEARGPQYSPSPAEYEALLAWAADYWQRQSSSSSAGHAKICAAFAGHKITLRSRAEVAAFTQQFANSRERA